LPTSSGVSAEAHQTLRQAGWVAAQRVLFLATGFLFVALIPRLMGPQVYGQFTLLQSMTFWFSILSSMGTISVMTRFVPEFETRGDRAGLNRLVSGLLALRIGSGALAGLGYGAVVMVWLGRDVTAAPVVWLTMAVAMRAIATLPYSLFLGLNQGGRFELGEAIRRVSGLGFVYLGFRGYGFAGACAGLMLAEMAALGCGVWWARGYLVWPQVRFDWEFLAPFLRFGGAFLVGNVLVMLFHQGGAGIVQFYSGQYAETGFYHLAFHLYLTVTQAAWGVLLTFGALFSSLRSQGKVLELRAWAERLLCFLGMASVVGCAMAFTHGEMVIRLVVGKQYLAVAPLLPWLAIATLSFAPGGLARLLAVTYGLPQSSTWSAVLQLLTFLAACMVWVPRWGSRGACLAVILAGAAFAALGTWQIRNRVQYSLRRWSAVVLLGGVLSPIFWAWTVDPTLRLAVFLLGYGTGLWSLGILRREEWAMLWRRPS